MGKLYGRIGAGLGSAREASGHVIVYYYKFGFDGKFLSLSQKEVVWRGSDGMATTVLVGTTQTHKKNFLLEHRRPYRI